MFSKISSEKIVHTRNHNVIFVGRIDSFFFINFVEKV